MDTKDKLIAQAEILGWALSHETSWEDVYKRAKQLRIEAKAAPVDTPRIEEELRCYNGPKRGDCVKCEGYPGIAHDFETAKLRIADLEAKVARLREALDALANASEDAASSDPVMISHEHTMNVFDLALDSAKATLKETA